MQKKRWESPKEQTEERYAKKELGQNFLHNKTVLKSVAEAGEIIKGQTVIEIGPGRGALTGELLESGAQVIAVEKDREMVDVLGDLFVKEIRAGQLSVIEADILKTDLAALVPTEGDYKVIGNIPYYITGAIIEHICSATRLPTIAVLMVQKEVALRIARNESKSSILSISVEAYGTPEYIRTVPRGNFSPAPNVDSAILRIKNLSRTRFEKAGISEQRFFEVLKTGMGQKRKMLSNNLKSMIDQEKFLNYITVRGYSEKVRAEELSVDDWFEIARL